MDSIPEECKPKEINTSEFFQGKPILLYPDKSDDGDGYRFPYMPIVARWCYEPRREVPWAKGSYWNASWGWCLIVNQGISDTNKKVYFKPAGWAEIPNIEQFWEKPV